MGTWKLSKIKIEFVFFLLSLSTVLYSPNQMRMKTKIKRKNKYTKKKVRLFSLSKHERNPCNNQHNTAARSGACVCIDTEYCAEIGSKAKK